MENQPSQVQTGPAEQRVPPLPRDLYVIIIQIYEAEDAAEPPDRPRITEDAFLHFWIDRMTTVPIQRNDTTGTFLMLQFRL